MTNREWLNNISNMDFADIVCLLIGGDCTYIKGKLRENCDDWDCDLCIVDWLQSEYREPEPELKSCPMCGGNAELLQGTPHEELYRIRCTECELSTNYFSKNKAIEAWNNRV